MSTPEDTSKTVNRHLELASQGRADDIAELYAADGTVEDPVGGEVHIGRQAIRGFYDSLPSTGALGDFGVISIAQRRFSRPNHD